MSENQLQSTDQSSLDSDNEGVEAREELINTFWDKYENDGVEPAGEYFREQVQGSIDITKLLIPYLLDEGKRRGIDLIKVVQEMQTINLEEQDNAIGTIDDGGRVPVVSDNEADDPENEDESASTRNDAGGDAETQ